MDGQGCGLWMHLCICVCCVDGLDMVSTLSIDKMGTRLHFASACMPRHKDGIRLFLVSLCAAGPGAPTAAAAERAADSKGVARTQRQTGASSLSKSASPLPHACRQPCTPGPLTRSSVVVVYLTKESGLIRPPNHISPRPRVHAESNQTIRSFACTYTPWGGCGLGFRRVGRLQRPPHARLRRGGYGSSRAAVAADDDDAPAVPPPPPPLASSCGLIGGPCMWLCVM